MENLTVFEQTAFLQGKELKGGRGRTGGTGCGFQSQSSGDGFTRATPVALAISVGEVRAAKQL